MKEFISSFLLNFLSGINCAYKDLENSPLKGVPNFKIGWKSTSIYGKMVERACDNLTS
jgi:hypothetical protein